MTILKTLLFLGICLSSILSFGQTGKLTVTAYDDYYSNTCYLYLEDSLINIKYFEDGMGVDFDSLETGKYKLKIIGSEDFRTTLYPIQIRNNEITYLTIYSPYIWSKKSSDSIKYEKFETAFKFLTNLNSNGTSPLINRNYQIGITQGSIFNKKNLGTILSLGSSFSYTDFQNDTSFYNTISNIKNERYFGWNLDACIMGRLSTYDMRKDYKKGAYLDIGVSYHFPLLFRHVYKIENRKYITKKIHNYKNLTPTFRLGYNGVAITYQYQLLDYIKESFPQNPKHTVGLTFLIEG